jgi:hypothetical protein
MARVGGQPSRRTLERHDFYRSGSWMCPGDSYDEGRTARTVSSFHAPGRSQARIADPKPAAALRPSATPLLPRSKASRAAPRYCVRRVHVGTGHRWPWPAAAGAFARFCYLATFSVTPHMREGRRACICNKEESKERDRGAHLALCNFAKKYGPSQRGSASCVNAVAKNGVSRLLGNPKINQALVVLDVLFDGGKIHSLLLEINMKS